MASKALLYVLLTNMFISFKGSAKRFLFYLLTNISVLGCVLYVYFLNTFFLMSLFDLWLSSMVSSAMEIVNSALLEGRERYIPLYNLHVSRVVGFFDQIRSLESCSSETLISIFYSANISLYVAAHMLHEDAVVRMMRVLEFLRPHFRALFDAGSIDFDVSNL